MSKPLSDYAVIGDTRTTALVARDGALDWLCWPRHDSPAVFTRLLDDAHGGSFTLHIEGGVPDGRGYAGDTNILETRFRAPGGAGTLIDFMPVEPPATHPTDGPDGTAQTRVIRLLRCTGGGLKGMFRLQATPDYGRAIAVPQPDEGGGVLIETPDLVLHLFGSGSWRVHGTVTSLSFDLAAGESAWAVLTHRSARALPPLELEEEVTAILERTRAYWSGWAGGLTYDGPYRAAVVRSALVLKLLTYAPTGAIVAAATTSLPEAVPGNRNYDYRYNWIRDASFTVTAFCNVGANREAAEYLRYLRNADGTKGADLRLLYGIDGPVEAEQELPHLPGWNNVGPVRIGNAARDQQQHDIYGEFVLALHAYLSSVDFRPPEPLATHLPDLITVLADKAASVRDEPDHGIWELRSGKEQSLHTRR